MLSARRDGDKGASCARSWLRSAGTSESALCCEMGAARAPSSPLAAPAARRAKPGPASACPRRDRAGWDGVPACPLTSLLCPQALLELLLPL